MAEGLDRIYEAIDTTVARQAAAVDEQGVFPEESIAALRQAGALGLVSASEVGGMGGTLRQASEIITHLAGVCGSTAMVLCMHYCAAAVIEQHGAKKVRRAIAEGDHLTTLAFSEAGSRSHFWAPTGSAALDGREVVLNARKSWVTAAHYADSYVWSSRPARVRDQISTLWLVPRDIPGISAADGFDGIGLRGNDSVPVTAVDARLPKNNRLGDDGEGFPIMMQVVLPYFNVLNASVSLGIMQAATAHTLEHISGVRFEEAGQGLNELPTIRAYAARMRMRTDMVHGLLQDTLLALESGRQEDIVLRILESKAAAGETATEVLDLAMRICGGAAFRKEAGLDRLFRDSRAAGVMAPTTDVLYDFIGKAITGMELF